MNEDLRNWFREKWVNIAKKKKTGGYEPCGTSGKKKGYAKCVPAAKAARMNKGEIQSAVRRKRAAQSAAGRSGKEQPGQGNKPIMVKTMKEGLGYDNEWGRPELTRKWLKHTPGQVNAVVSHTMKRLKEFWNETNTLDEGVLMEKGLTPGGRLKKRLAAVRSRKKRKLAKSMSLRRTASPQKIEKRAKLAARRMMYKRVLRGRSRSTLSPAERSSIETIMKRAPIQAAIKRAVIRLKPQYRNLDTKRRTRRTRRK